MIALYAQRLVSTSKVYFRLVNVGFFSDLQKGDCNSSDDESVGIDELVRSPCASSFNWTISSPNSVRNVSVLKCDFETASQQIGDALSLLKVNRDIEKCLIYAMPLICHAVYRDCESETSVGRPSESQCVMTRNDYCKKFWEAS